MQFFFEPEWQNLFFLTAHIDGQVRLYDSNFPGNLSTCVTNQICQVYRTAVVDEKVLIAVVAVQQQNAISALA